MGKARIAEIKLTAGLKMRWSCKPSTLKWPHLHVFKGSYPFKRPFLHGKHIGKDREYMAVYFLKACLHLLTNLLSTVGLFVCLFEALVSRLHPFTK